LPLLRSNSRRKFIAGVCKRRKPYLFPFIKREFRISKSNFECRRKGSLCSAFLKSPSVPLFQRGRMRFAAVYHFSKGEDGSKSYKLTRRRRTSLRYSTFDFDIRNSLFNRSQRLIHTKMASIGKTIHSPRIAAYYASSLTYTYDSA